MFDYKQDIGLLHSSLLSAANLVSSVSSDQLHLSLYILNFYLKNNIQFFSFKSFHSKK